MLQNFIFIYKITLRFLAPHCTTFCKRCFVAQSFLTVFYSVFSNFCKFFNTACLTQVTIVVLKIFKTFMKKKITMNACFSDKSMELSISKKTSMEPVLSETPN